ncbi:MAG: thiamine-phosphate kinase [Gammaproteobacteria bacterium]
MDEFDLIARYFQPLTFATSGLELGIGDDAAVFSLPPGEALVVTVDTLVEGVHFPDWFPPAAIASRLAAVNLSDLAAMGATPRYATLALTLPRVDPAWLAAFASALGAALAAAGMSLVGGDTTRGPLTLTLQAMGSVPAGQALTRGGARPGDLVVVSGTLGDARAGLDVALATLRADADDPLLARFVAPTARVALGRALRGLAHAAIDVSDGLLADLGHIATRSGCGARIDVARLPLSATLREGIGYFRAREFALAGGDDYELVLAVPPDRLAAAEQRAGELGVPLTVIGEFVAGAGVVCHDAGHAFEPAARGYLHFE